MLRFSEDFAAVTVFPCNIIETSIRQSTSLFHILSNLGNITLLTFEELICKCDIPQCVLDVRARD